MKILQINSVCNYGSTGKITYEIHKYLLDAGIESLVCYGRLKCSKELYISKICTELYSKANNALSRLTGLMYGGCWYSTCKLIRKIKKEKPDIVHLQCINGYFVNIYKLVNWLNKNKIRTVLTLHAEFMYTANCAYAYECEKWKYGCGRCEKFRLVTKSIFRDKTASSWKKMRKSFEDFSSLRIVSVSPWLMNRAMQSPFFADKKHLTILNGVDSTVFKHIDDLSLRRKNGLINKKIVFHATPSFSNNPNDIKGGYYVLELAKLMPDIVFVVAGRHSVKHVPKNVILLGDITRQSELAGWYSTADVTLLTSKRETFSMVTAESLCCGTPVVGFKAGAPEQITIKEYSDFVEYANIKELKVATQNMMLNTFSRIEIAKLAEVKYGNRRMVNEYIKCYKEILNEDFN